ncbi:hypothetical protein BOTBODRAFT_104640 [Botryobasidium botryosum FD-172 SS1]|uniref:Uncharacterized protein n=1 Tax=Botryobasidium botryosum (strain FD-172 SS1) TaxID=930990 RepID=A0A067MQH0_BOTB1|nr:hypothetical protein BOTBODRAFT_104640 [Botryobasidium botryosum FD-172 SS1]
MAKRPERTSLGGSAPSSSTTIANALSPELKNAVDGIFIQYLNRICSNLDATDSKGEPIHQTLMAKKMARLDESPDFRPFKFRIQAFTNGFIEELAAQGYAEDIIPVKKVRAHVHRCCLCLHRTPSSGQSISVAPAAVHLPVQ